MSTNSYYNKVRLDYTLVFSDFMESIILPTFPFYEQWFDEVFTHAKELLLNNRYITVVGTMRYHKRTYITDLIETFFAESVSDHIVAICDSGSYDVDPYGGVTTTSFNPELNVDQNRLIYLEENELNIKSNMFYIAQNIFTVIFHEIYLFTLQSRDRGIRFSDILYKRREDMGSFIITCQINQEVIKNHDKEWYDRLSLLYPV